MSKAAAPRKVGDKEALAAVKGHPKISSLTVVKLPAAGELPEWLG